MSCILVRPALFVVIALSLSPLLAGCSGGSGDPLEQASESVAEANEAINEHNGLFDEARNLYEEAREAIEDGEEPSDEAERIAQARETMQEARDNLEEARQPLTTVQNPQVDSTVKEYAQLLTDTLDAQLAAEAREIEFYEILEEDPTLDEDRERALDLLTQISEGYQRAKDSYGQAQELADANPELLQEG
jgi:uncharacterized phage infection (PIP) family protein YhgE